MQDGAACKHSALTAGQPPSQACSAVILSCQATPQLQLDVASSYVVVHQVLASCCARQRLGPEINSAKRKSS